MNIKFEDLVGLSGILCAVDGFKFRIGNLTFEAIEDENDGYRSCLNEIQVVENIRPVFRENVRITYDGEYFQLFAENDKCVLKIGTDHHDDYYPCFVFEWEPQNLTSYIDINTLINTVDENI